MPPGVRSTCSSGGGGTPRTGASVSRSPDARRRRPRRLAVMNERPPNARFSRKASEDGFFPDFEPFEIDIDGVCIRGRRGGTGPPLLLLHGYPQTHVMWHRIAPTLASTFDVVVADLRGYGASDKPASDADHAAYSKRAMARDMVGTMAALGHERFDVAGHDRGGRVAHRLAADHPERVRRLMVLDIAPTREMYARTDDAFARAYWHWFLLIRPAPFPERLIGADPDAWLRHVCGSIVGGDPPFDEAALSRYLEAFRDPECVRASCEDYRAAASIDIRHDDEDGDARIACPLRVLWGEDGVVARCFDPLALWRLRASNVSGRALPGAHYFPEQVPDLVVADMLEFFSPEPLRGSAP